MRGCRASQFIDRPCVRGCLLMGLIDHCLKHQDRSEAMDHPTQVRELGERHRAQLEFRVAGRA